MLMLQLLVWVRHSCPTPLTWILVLILISERKLGRITEACSNVEKRRFKRRAGRPKKSTRLQPLRDVLLPVALK